jgi:hypothetical protein
MWVYTGSAWSKLATVSNGDGNNSINLSGTNNRIEIRDGSGTVRVKIGNLS